MSIRKNEREKIIFKEFRLICKKYLNRVLSADEIFKDITVSDFIYVLPQQVHLQIYIVRFKWKGNKYIRKDSILLFILNNLDNFLLEQI